MDTKIQPIRKKVFKPYDQNQIIQVPIQVEDFIGPGHLVRIIDGVVEQIKMEQLEAYYSGGGSKDLSIVGEAKEVKVVLNSYKVSEYLCDLNTLIEKASGDKVRQKGLKKAQTALLKEHKSLEKYELQEQLLQGRNSFSKTDIDATAMRMKDDRILPGYNIQHSTTNQYIVNYTVEQNASDRVTLGAHLDKKEERFQGLPKAAEENLCSDAGYGSEENYANLEERGINAYVKYSLFYQEHSGKLAKRKFLRENFPYDDQKDEFTCPNNRKLSLCQTKD